jgi:sortase A
MWHDIDKNKSSKSKTLNLHELKDENSQTNLEWNPYFRKDDESNVDDQEVKIKFKTDKVVEENSADNIYADLISQQLPKSSEVSDTGEIVNKKNHPKSKKVVFIKKISLTLGVAVSVFTLLVSLFLLGAPFFPEFLLMYQRSRDDTAGYKYRTDYITQEISRNNIQVDIDKLQPIPKDNTLVIPSIQVDAKIHEGQSENTLNNGIWRKPNTSMPINGGNTVLTAHRFMNITGPNTFYALDKVTTEDKLFIFWEGKEYVYDVYESRIVKPTQLEIEANTEEEILTLYTCHPLWTSDERLVVRAKLINQ